MIRRISVGQHYKYKHRYVKVTSVRESDNLVRFQRVTDMTRGTATEGNFKEGAGHLEDTSRRACRLIERARKYMKV